MKQITAGGQTFGVNETWGDHLDYQEQVGEFWQQVKAEDPPLQKAIADIERMRHAHLCRVLAEVDGQAVTDANAMVRGLDPDTVQALFVALGIAEKQSSAEGNAEGGSTSLPIAGSEDSQ